MWVVSKLWQFGGWKQNQNNKRRLNHSWKKKINDAVRLCCHAVSNHLFYLFLKKGPCLSPTCCTWRCFTEQSKWLRVFIWSLKIKCHWFSMEFNLFCTTLHVLFDSSWSPLMCPLCLSVPQDVHSGGRSHGLKPARYCGRWACCLERLWSSPS